MANNSKIYFDIELVHITWNAPNVVSHQLSLHTYVTIGMSTYTL